MWWSRRSWRAWLGWILLGWAVLAVCVALLAWAWRAPGITNNVATWANILSLPVAAFGLVLVLVDRRRARVMPAGIEARRRPWMAPPLDRIVQRPELAGQLVAALVGPGGGEVGLTTGLQGAGGFGKTRLATWVCHRPEVDRRFPGGLLWVTVGQQVRGADLAVRINDVAYVLGGRRPAIVDPDAAGAELGRLLDERLPVLLVIDDVWEESQLRPFRVGGRCCTRLVTTRIPDLLPVGARCVPVDAMSPGQARELVSDGVPGLAGAQAQRLALLAGRWPVLLNLVNGALRRRVAQGQAPHDAARQVAERLVAQGPAALDPTRPADRSRAVAATVEASLVLLDVTDQRRYLELGIFLEDVDIPVSVLSLLWPDCRVDTFGEELAGLGLVAEYRLDPPGPRLVLHDVMRAYLQVRASSAERAAVHDRLIDAAAGLLPTVGSGALAPWWQLPDDAGYLWRYLPYHLHAAGRAGELADLVGDLRWVEAKTRLLESVVAVEADLQLVVDTPTSQVLRSALAQAANLLGPIEPADALGATLASRLDGVAGLQATVERYRATLPRPRLQPLWPLPDRPDPTRPATPTGHTGWVHGCAFSPDATLLASTGADATVRLWQVRSRAVQRVLSGHDGAVFGCAFSPDGRLLASTGDDATVRLWQVHDGLQLAVLRGHTGAAAGCVFSPDGQLLASSGADATVRLWRVHDGALHTVLAGHTRAVDSCAFSPDGALLATASDDGTVRLWRVRDGARRAVLTGHTGTVNDCAFSPDGTLLATTGQDTTVRLWGVRDHLQRAVLTGHTKLVSGCVFSPDGALLATTSWDMTGRLWQVSTGEELAVLNGHSARLVGGCAFSGDGRLLATTSVDATVRLWRIPDGTAEAVLPGNTDWAGNCAFSPDGALLAVARADASVHLWHVADHTRHSILTGERWMDSCVFSPDGTLLAATGVDPAVLLWRIPEGIRHKTLTGHTDRVTCCAFSPDGTLLATAGWDRTVRLWRIPDGTQQAAWTGHTDDIWSCAFSPDGTLLASCGFDRTVRLWRIPDGTVHAILSHTAEFDGCAFSPNGTLLAAACIDGTLRLWHTATATSHRVLTGHTSMVFQSAFSPDGVLLATTSNDRTIRLWHVATGRCHCAIRLAVPVERIAWHPNGTTICVVGGAGVYLLAYLP